VGRGRRREHMEPVAQAGAAGEAAARDAREAAEVQAGAAGHAVWGARKQKYGLATRQVGFGFRFADRLLEAL
jgi:hypothetical protein